MPECVVNRFLRNAVQMVGSFAIGYPDLLGAAELACNSKKLAGLRGEFSQCQAQTFRVSLDRRKTARYGPGLLHGLFKQAVNALCPVGFDRTRLAQAFPKYVG